MSKQFTHFNLTSRKTISNLITTKRASAKQIAEVLGCDPTAISKELKRNRIVSRQSRVKDPICKKTLRYPYVCDGCELKYSCPKKQYHYDVSKAQSNANYNLVATRRGINLTKEEFEILDKKIKDGIEDGKSIYHIVHDDKEIIVSVPTVYRYIDKKILTTRKIDLPYATTYKKRKKKIKEYEYPSNRKIDRSNRTYSDYLLFRFNNPGLFEVQMDFLGSIKKDTNSILTLVIPELHFLFMRIIKNKNGNKIVNFFNQLEAYIGIDNFKKLFPLILTDRDPSFAYYEELEINSLTGEVRTQIFFCDAFMSNQKASVENMNKQLRRYFPKGKSIDEVNNNRVIAINKAINSRRLPSLSSSRPDEVFIKVYGEELLEKLYTFNFIDE